MASLEDVALLHQNKNELHHKSCCKPACYRPRRVKNKGALLVLAWNFLAFSVFHLIIDYSKKRYTIEACFAILGITSSIAGWLADTRIGRYKMVCTSNWVMWIAAVIATMSSVVAHLYESYVSFHSYLVAVALLAMAIGLGGFQATIIQFGLDQLHDASTSEIKSFIVWFVWSAYCQGIPMDFAFACLNIRASRIYKLLLVCVNLSLAMILDYSCNHCLIKEPIKQNPLKLVYKVIRYAIRNKYPRQRSAFTYCEDELPSRIDFGKSKYGGPFTTEQVEDVKTFFRFVLLAIVAGVLAGSILTSKTIRDNLHNQFSSPRHIGITKSTRFHDAKCYFEASFIHTIYFGAAILIPLYETLIYPIFFRCFPWMESRHKILMGTVALIARVLTLMAYNVVSRHNSLQMNGPNVTIPCLFETQSTEGVLNESFNYKWIIVPDFLSTISLTMFYIGLVEFISAQVPFFMKGLMIGMTYCAFFLSGALWLAVSLPFTYIHSIWGTGTLSCGFWYMLLLTIVDLGIFLILVILTRWYKKRQRRRQDVLPNEHFFAERYYSESIIEN